MSTPLHRVPSDQLVAARLPFTGPFSGELPANEALVQVTFHFAPSSGHDSWEKLSFIIPLSASLYDLSEGVQDACHSAFSINAHFLRALYAQGRDVAGSANVFFPDGLDVFANRTPDRRFRLDTVGDLFTTAELKEQRRRVVSVRVALRIVDKPVGGASSAVTRPPVKEYSRENTLPLPYHQRCSVSSHSPMVQAALHPQKCQCALPLLCDSLILTPTREVNGLEIGSVDDAVEATVSALCDANDHEQSVASDAPIPELPTLTFNEYQTTANHIAVGDYLKTTGQRFELAIRFVNKIPSSHHHIHVNVPRSEYAFSALPANVLVSIKHCPGQKKLICDILEAKLREFGPVRDHEGSDNSNSDDRNNNTPNTFISLLFSDAFRPNWQFHLWILPQPPSSRQVLLKEKEKEKKMYRFHGGLVNYLNSASLVSSALMGKRGNVKMYMEAHLALV